MRTAKLAGNGGKSATSYRNFDQDTAISTEPKENFRSLEEQQGRNAESSLYRWLRVLQQIGLNVDRLALHCGFVGACSKLKLLKKTAKKPPARGSPWAGDFV